MPMCKKCGHDEQWKTYVGFFPTEQITLAHNRNPNLPKYGFHWGAECRKCGAWQKFLPQTDAMLLKGKFYDKE